MEMEWKFNKGSRYIRLGFLWFLIFLVETRSLHVESRDYRLFSDNFRFYRFFGNKTGSWYFKGMVANIFVRKLIIASQKRGFSTIFG